MFLVVIQLGAILAVVRACSSTELNPFSPSKSRARAARRRGSCGQRSMRRPAPPPPSIGIPIERLDGGATLAAPIVDRRGAHRLRHRVHRHRDRGAPAPMRDRVGVSLRARRHRARASHFSAPAEAPSRSERRRRRLRPHRRALEEHRRGRRPSASACFQVLSHRAGHLALGLHDHRRPASSGASASRRGRVHVLPRDPGHGRAQAGLQPRQVLSSPGNALTGTECRDPGRRPASWRSWSRSPSSASSWSFVRRHDFKPFGWYRIVLGVAVIAWFALVA